MSSLTSLTLKAALDGLAAKSFSAVEITQAHVEAVEAARALNAFVLETPEQAIEMAKASDARRAAGASARRPAPGSSATSSPPMNPPSPPTCGATGR
jgi:aspartyl-tRNA(Asn)/glutamyl-tRNA(Gln) amidotransferase subunit A